MDLDEVFKAFCNECDADTWHEFSTDPEFITCLDCYFVHRKK